MPNCVHSVCWHVCVSKHTQDGSVVPDASSSVQLCVYADLISSPLGTTSGRRRSRSSPVWSSDLSLSRSHSSAFQTCLWLLSSSQFSFLPSLLPTGLCAHFTPPSTPCCLMWPRYKWKPVTFKEANVRPSSPSASAVQGSIRLPAAWMWN